MDEQNKFIDDVCDFIDQQEIFSRPCHECLDEKLDALNIDSLEMVDLSLSLEKKFDKRVNFDIMDSSTTLKQLIEDLIDA